MNAVHKSYYEDNDDKVFLCKLSHPSQKPNLSLSSLSNDDFGRQTINYASQKDATVTWGHDRGSSTKSIDTFFSSPVLKMNRSCVTRKGSSEGNRKENYADVALLTEDANSFFFAQML